jgi:hypothetical protein
MAKRHKVGRLRKYSIHTDSGSMNVEAKSANAAVTKFMGPGSKVRTVQQLKHHLERAGGYGVVEGDDEGILLRVR